MHENILLGVGFRGSHWSRFRSRFTKSMTSKNYNKLWNLTFRYKLFITSVSSTEFVGCMYMILSLSVRSLLRTKVRSFVRSFVRSCVRVRWFVRLCVRVCSFVCSCVRVCWLVFFSRSCLFVCLLVCSLPFVRLLLVCRVGFLFYTYPITFPFVH